jgi:hypothetical protein
MKCIQNFGEETSLKMPTLDIEKEVERWKYAMRISCLLELAQNPIHFRAFVLAFLNLQALLIQVYHSVTE